MKVLVVDDEEAVLEQLSDGLSASGFDAVTARSAAQARARLEADAAIGVVVSDIRMPGQHGLDLAQAIIAGQAEERAVEVIIITGHATIEDAATAVRHQVFDFLRKPFRLAEVVRAVSAALERAGRRRREAARARQESQRLVRLEEERASLDARLREAVAQLETGAMPPTASRALQRDMAAISHALRTPLNAISGGAALLAEAGEPRQEEHAALLREGITHAMAAIALVEELHRIERPDPDDVVIRLPLKNEVERALRQAAPEAAAKGLVLTPGALAEVALEGPARRLRRAIELTLGAATEWAPAGSAIDLDLNEQRAGGRRWAVLTVLTAPAGTTPAPPEGVTFDTAGSALARTQEGLRFAIARRLAEQRGGFLTSWNGEGLSMALRLALPL